MFKQKTIRATLDFSFYVMFAFFLLVSGFAAYELKLSNNSIQSVYLDRTVPVSQLGDIRVLLLQGRNRLNASLALHNANEDAFTLNIVEKNKQTIDKLWQGYMASRLTDEEAQLAKKLETVRQAWQAGALKPGLEAVRNHNYPELETIITTKVRELFDPVETTVDQLTELQIKIAAQEYQAAQQRFMFALGAMALLGFGSVIFGFLSRKALMDRILQPLEHGQQFVSAIAHGQLNAPLKIEHEDEIGSLLTAMRPMQKTLTTLIGEMQHMAVEHDKGDIEVFVNTDKFDGDFKTIAKDVNELVAAHINTKKKVLAVVKEFGEGNFDAPLEQFPGKKAFLNDTVEKVRSNIKGFVADMQHMSAEHNKGDIDVLMSVDKYQGTYKTMAQGVNEMVGGHIAVKKKALATVMAFGNGDFDAPLERFPGKKAFVNDTVEKVRGNIKNFITDMQHMSAEHDKGDIDVWMDINKYQGAYKTMAQGVNEMVGGHIAVKKKAMAVVKAFGEGNFDAPLERFPGKKAFINDTIEQVRSNINRVIADIDYLAEAAQAGRIDTRADASKHKGDFRRIVDGVNATLETIVEPILVVKSATDSINTAAKEIASGNADLSQRTEEQASSLEETASSMEELASTVRQNSENARQANQMAVAASDVAVRGGDVVQQVVHTMGAINDSARKIVDIISVIDGIAFQTNILALNAAVEAARAGEQGRGFAVVAGEVRSLAQRSAAAAKEIKTLIGDSVEKVEDGSRLVNEAGKTMGEIVNSVRRVTDIMSEIAAASIEQSSGIEQVNQAINQMDEVTQQNAALVEEAAAAAESLEEQASMLAETIAHFQLQGQAQVRNVVPKLSHSPVPQRMPMQANAGRHAPIISNNTQNDDDWTEF